METQHSKSMRFNKSCSKSSLYQHKLSSEKKKKKTSNKLPNPSAKKIRKKKNKAQVTEREI